MNPEPGDAEIIQAAINALRKQAEAQTPLGQERSKGQTAVARALRESAVERGEKPMTTGMVQKAITGGEMGIRAAHYVRRHFRLGIEEFVKKFGGQDSDAGEPWATPRGTSPRKRQRRRS